MGDRGRIAVGAVGLGDEIRGGLDRYTRAVLATLLPRGGYICYSGSRAVHREHGAHVRRAPGGVMPENNWKGNLARLLWHQAVLPRRLAQDGASLFYSPVAEGMLAPRVPQVVTIHDLLPLHFPEVYPRLKYYCRHLLPHIIAASAAVIVDSEATRADLRRFFGESGTPIHVIHPGYDERLFRPPAAAKIAACRARHGLGDYLLSVGETRAYKNIRGLIHAFAAAAVPQLTLAIAGSISRLDPEVAQLPERLGIGERVRFLGHVPDEELPLLYAGALAFAFPSLYEGFGLPPLEAMACGCPVIASSAASVPEVCGRAALYVDPGSIESIARAIRTLAGDAALRRSLAGAGLEQAARFSDRRTSEQISAVLEEVGARAPAPRRRRAEAPARRPVERAAAQEGSGS